MQVFDNSGNTLIDTSTFVGNIVNSFTTSQTSGSITNSLLTTGTPFAFVSVAPVGQSAGMDTGDVTPTWPKISFSGNRLSWTGGEDSKATNIKPITIYYGVF